MKIIISNSSSVPIYEQIKQEIINQIITGELREDEALPSIRSLAKDIRISVMTIKKAYDELEREGYIVTRQGKGSFIASKNLELIREQLQREIEEYMIRIIELSAKCNISKKEIVDLFQFMMEGEGKWKMLLK